MRKTTKYLAIGALVVGAFMFWVFSGDSEEAINNMDQTVGAYDESDYYTLTLEDESEVDILVPYSISKGMVRNLRDEREHDIFASIYAYDNDDDVYLMDIPDDEETFSDILDAPYSAGTLFNFTLELMSGVDSVGLLAGEVVGDNSIDSYMIVDATYLSEDVYDLNEGDVVSFDVVYAGLKESSPLFIGLDME